MSQIIIESKLLLKSKFKLSLALVVIFATLLSLDSFALTSMVFNNSINDIGNRLRVSEKSYKLSDNGLDVSKFYTSLSSLINLKNFYNQLTHNNDIYFYEIINQPVYLQLSSKDDSLRFKTFATNYDSGSIDDVITINKSWYFPVKNLSIDMNTYNLFEFDIFEGRSFDVNDMIYDESKIIPVILGYSYSDLFSIGDSFKVNHLRFDLEFKVVGILSKDFCMPLGNELVDLNRYIITPSLTFPNSPKSEEELFFQGISYLQKINGYIILKKCTLQEFSNFIEKIRLSNGLFDFSIIGSNGAELSIIQAFIFTNSYEISFIVLCMVFISILITVHLINLLINLRKDVFKVYEILGYSKKFILSCKTTASVMVTVPAFCLSFLFSLYVGTHILLNIIIYAVTIFLLFICLNINQKRR